MFIKISNASIMYLAYKNALCTWHSLGGTSLLLALSLSFPVGNPTWSVSLGFSCLTEFLDKWLSCRLIYSSMPSATWKRIQTEMWRGLWQSFVPSTSLQASAAMATNLECSFQSFYTRGRQLPRWHVISWRLQTSLRGKFTCSLFGFSFGQVKDHVLNGRGLYEDVAWPLEA